jgi:LPXTG-motif cell wall-anchored protein
MREAGSAHGSLEGDMTTILIIVVVFLLLGGGGFYGFRRR